MASHNIARDRFPEKILTWYDEHARELPWRSQGGERPDPYHVWLSEIMLQQTTVATVGPYFQKFLDQWPTVKHLALAPLDDVLTAWAGLGYYARARNLHKCAGVVWHNYGGQFPGSEDELLTLPGVGPYTAAAIAAIAFDEPAVVIDGNIERIICRVFQLEETLPAGRPVIKEHAATVTPKDRPGDYAQALMDIGSRICRPKKPACDRCPVTDLCHVSGQEIAEAYPKKAPKKVKPVKSAFVLWIENEKGEVLMRRRPEKGLLGGMMEFPSTDWTEGESQPSEVGQLKVELGLEADENVQAVAQEVVHTFTHFQLKLSPQIYQVAADQVRPSNQLQWIAPTGFGDIALPTLMNKVVKVVSKGQGSLPL
ncbi:A/G-specific adenine glycosylase [Sneathiella limimaris]|uniref:A/G-specific adenine glycosylase n=1 Tax=Sneathiella limimaris TaxID=1964213 RepID=UPI00146CD3FE|nr:A/G-specific adenine glycosylase [Sneathiella limimaris]